MGSLTQKMGLATWDQILDRYDYQQLSNNWQIISFHDHSPGRGVQIGPAGIAAGAIGSQQIAPALAQNLGLNVSGTTGRGALYNPGPGTRSNTTAGALSDAADQVTGIVLNTNGLINVSFHALWSVNSGSAFASVMLNGVSVAMGQTINGVAVGNTWVSTAATFLSPLYTSSGTATALATTASTTANASEATTGETIGGPHLSIFAPAGIYTVSVQYSTSTTNTVTVQNRRLWVWTVNF